jgi:hypothetical protein
MYYVSVIDGPRIGGEIEVKHFGLLAGPYEKHDEALDRVETVRKIALEINAWAHFYAFGTGQGEAATVSRRAVEPPAYSSGKS